MKSSVSLGDLLEGDRIVSTAYVIPFATDLDYQIACSKQLSTLEVQEFRKAVESDYYYQMYFDDLPLWGFLGRVGTAGKIFLYSYVHFDIMYNEDKVIGLNVTADVRTMVDVTSDTHMEIKFIYSSRWISTNLPFERRMDRYSYNSLLPQHLEVHWFSIMNSCVIVLLLIGFLATILMRVLKNDTVKFTKDDEMGEDQEESSWRYLQGDVFRFPRPLSLFCAMMGTGTQFLLIAFCFFVLVTCNLFSPYDRGTMKIAFVVLYIMTSGIAGYSSSSWYKALGGSHWSRSLLLTSIFFMGPFLLIFSILNSIAMSYGSTKAVPFSTVMNFVLLWSLISFPMTIIGGMMGKNSKDSFQVSCRVTKYPKEIPPLPWYQQTATQMAIAGFLPFSAIYIELHYLFSSIWGHKLYIVWSVLVIVFVILIIVTALVTVTLTYFQLSAEDYQWWWRSFLCGGSIGLFIFGYCFYFYFRRSGMYGLLQTSFFFGYMGVVCYAVFLMLGSIGFNASLIFVRQIYRTIKNA
eukprot:g4451.t1